MSSSDAGSIPLLNEVDRYYGDHEIAIFQGSGLWGNLAPVFRRDIKGQLPPSFILFPFCISRGALQFKS